MAWNYDHNPTWWQLFGMLGPGLCLAAGVAALTGFFVVRAILVPPGASGELSRADRLALVRTWIGFAFVAVISLPYRSFGDTTDKALGTFNIGVPVALGVGAVVMAAIYLVIGDQARATFRAEFRPAVARVGKFIAVLVIAYGVILLIDPDHSTGHDRAVLGLIAVGALVGVYSAGCWYISRFWFGIGRVHPLLPPLVAMITVGLMTAIELHHGGPDRLPTHLWLLINFAAVISTFGVCFVEVCDTWAREADPAQWPLVAAGIIAILGLAASVVFINSGAADRELCASPAHIVNCVSSTS